MQLGRRVTQADEYGHFSLPTEPGPKTIMAQLAGWEPQQVYVVGGLAGNPVTEITLGARLFSISGKLALAFPDRLRKQSASSLR